MTDTHGERPHRRSEDIVSWRDLLEMREWTIMYVADNEAKYHTARAESLTLIGRTLEKMDARMDEHDTYHRDILQQALAAMKDGRVRDDEMNTTAMQFAQNYRLALWAVAVSIAAVIASIVIPLLTKGH